MARLHRFKRASTPPPIQLTDRDCQIIRSVHRHRFLRSHQVIALIGGSTQQLLRRLQVLYHHGFLERPRAQLEYYQRPGSRRIVYGLGRKGSVLLRNRVGIGLHFRSRRQENPAVGRVFLEHALLVSNVMAALELACCQHGRVRLLYEDELALRAARQPFQWKVKLRGGLTLGVVPDRVFALDFPDSNGQVQRVHFFLEADRGTMPVKRSTLSQTSFVRKLLAYEATWTQHLHRMRLGIPRFRVITVTAIPGRVQSLVEACAELKRGQGLFLFADRSILDKPGEIFRAVWRAGTGNKLVSMLE